MVSIKIKVLSPVIKHNCPKKFDVSGFKQKKKIGSCQLYASTPACSNQLALQLALIKPDRFILWKQFFN
jgi:hypothetical protein